MGTNKKKTLFIILLIIFIIISIISFFKIAFSRHLDGVYEINMKNFLYCWEEEGKPEGKKLEKYIYNLRFWNGKNGIFLTNKLFIINETNFVANFFLVPGHTHKKILFFNTNNFVWVTSSGKIIGKLKEINPIND